MIAEQRTDDSSIALEAGLREHVPGFEVVDRDLDLDRAPGIGLPQVAGSPVAVRRADLLGLDRRGRLVLVLLVDGADDETVLSALDAVAFAQQTRAIAAQHWRARGASAHEEPLVVLIARSFDPRRVAALSTLRANAVRLFELRSLRASGRSAVYLLPRDLEGSTTARTPRTPAELGAVLDDATRALFTDVVRRVGRIDDDLMCELRHDAVHWNFRGRDLCALQVSRERLAGSVGDPPDDFVLEEPRHVEAFLDRVMRAYLSTLDGAGEPRNEREPQSGLFSSVPLLTPEEMAAFRD
jgi:hypothetical protein